MLYIINKYIRIKMKSEEFIKFSDPLKLFSLWFDEAKVKDSYNYNNIPNSKNYNSEDIMKLINEESKDTNIVIYCYHGNSSRKVASFISSYGFKNVYSLIGGIDAWENSL